MIHHLKTWPQFFQAIVHGEKTFEIRLNDRNFSNRDFLYLKEWEVGEGYTGNQCIVQVTYILGHEDVAGIEEGYVVMGISIIAKDE